MLYIGSRDGKVLAKISRSLHNGFVVGIDNAQPMVHYASSTYSYKEYSNLLFILADICQPLCYQQFDLVVSSCYLHWLEDQLAALKAIKTSLKPQGGAILVMPAKNLSTVSDIVSTTSKWKPYFENQSIKRRYYYDQEKYKALLEQAGLEPVEMSQTLLEDFFPNRQALIDWITPISSFIQVLPEDKQIEFVHDVVGAILVQNPAEEDGSIRLKSAKLEIIAITD